MVQCYTVAEVAQLLKVSRGTVLMAIRTGRLKARKVGRLWRVLEDDINQFLGIVAA